MPIHVDFVVTILPVTLHYRYVVPFDLFTVTLLRCSPFDTTVLIDTLRYDVVRYLRATVTFTIPTICAIYYVPGVLPGDLILRFVVRWVTHGVVPDAYVPH